ncbi:Cyclin-B1-1 [Echinococcus granulosus]|uniref:Cyclin-B1-1 n=1 Tax=Echinococcus granulosus TaxID=6210 RepID=W6UM41_ECHGR|nr:Cyclin-B1-1 [Echinococcus granulosus]EUB54564.1 Cyclin-B1-1 [Echinococcus granulosus]
MSQNGEGGEHEGSRRFSQPNYPSPRTQRRRLSSPPSGPPRNEVGAQADITRSPQSKRPRTTEDGEGPSPAYPDASPEEEPDATNDDQHTPSADTPPAQVGTPQPDRVEQHAPTADACPLQEEARILVIGFGTTTVTVVISLFILEDERYASTGNTCSLQEEALNLIRDEQHASAAFTASPEEEALNTIRDGQHPLLQQEGGTHVDVGEGPERRIISIAPQEIVNPVVELFDLTIKSQDVGNSSFDKTHRLELNLSSVAESLRMVINQYLTHLPTQNQLKESPKGFLAIDDFHDVLTEGDCQLYSRTLNEELDLDTRYVQSYNHQFLSRCGIAADTRNCLIQWMIQLNMRMGIPTQTLHIAVGLMDLYTCLRPIIRQEYQLLALGAIKMAIRIRSPNTPIEYKNICSIINGAYTPVQIIRMEETLRRCIGNGIYFPTPHRFLDLYMFGFPDFTDSILEWAMQACNYIFELGLCQASLCRYSASLRCAGVLYLIRRILGLRCVCGFLCSHCFKPAWPPSMVKFTGHSETKELRTVARLYGRILFRIKSYCIPYYTKHLTNIPYMASRFQQVREAGVRGNCSGPQTAYGDTKLFE